MYFLHYGKLIVIIIKKLEIEFSRQKNLGLKNYSSVLKTSKQDYLHLHKMRLIFYFTDSIRHSRWRHHAHTS